MKKAEKQGKNRRNIFSDCKERENRKGEKTGESDKGKNIRKGKFRQIFGILRRLPAYPGAYLPFWRGL